MGWSEEEIRKQELFDALSRMFDARDEAIRQDPAKYMEKVVMRLTKIEELLERVKFYLGGGDVLFSNTDDPSHFVTIEARLLLRQKKAMDIIKIYFKNRRMEDAR